MESASIKIIAMVCPGCGANLQVAPDMESFACGYCGTSLRAVRRGGTVSLIGEAIAKVQAGTDRTAAELALARLQRELDELDKKLETMKPPAAPLKDSTSLLGALYLGNLDYYLSARKFNRAEQEAYQQGCKEWEVTLKEIKSLKAYREELIAKISSFRKIVNQPL